MCIARKIDDIFLLPRWKLLSLLVENYYEAKKNWEEENREKIVFFSPLTRICLLWFNFERKTSKRRVRSGKNEKLTNFHTGCQKLGSPITAIDCWEGKSYRDWILHTALATCWKWFCAKFTVSKWKVWGDCGCVCNRNQLFFKLLTVSLNMLIKFTTYLPYFTHIWGK